MRKDKRQGRHGITGKEKFGKRRKNGKKHFLKRQCLKTLSMDKNIKSQIQKQLQL